MAEPLDFAFDLSFDLPTFSAGELMGSPAEAGVSPPDPLDRFQRLIRESKDPFTLDFEPSADADPEYVNVFGKAMDRSSLERTEYGKQLLGIVKANRGGRRGFGEAVTDVGWKDVPLIGDVMGDAAAIKEMDRVPAILDAIKEGREVSDDDLVLARYIMAHGERRAQATVAGNAGSIIRNLGAFGVDFYLYGQVAKAALMPLKGVGTRWAAKQAGVAVTSAATGPGAAVVAPVLEGAATAATVVDAAIQVPKIARAAKAGLSMSRAMKSAGAFMKEFTGKAIVGFTGEAIDGTKTVAELKAAADAAAATKKAMGYLGMAREGLGGLLVSAPLEGLPYLAIDQGVNAAFNTLRGEDPTITRAEVENRIAGAVSGNDRLRNNAKALALGDAYVQYLSERTGAHLGQLTFGMTGKALRDSIGDTAAAAKLKDLWGKVYPTRADMIAKRAKLSGAMAADPKMMPTMSMRMLDKMIKYNINAEAAWDLVHKAGYDGMIEEMAEERWGGFLQGLYGLDGSDPGLRNAWDKAWPTVDQLKAEAIAFAVPSMVVIGTGHLSLQDWAGGTGMAKTQDAATKIRDFVTAAADDGSVNLLNAGRVTIDSPAEGGENVRNIAYVGEAAEAIQELAGEQHRPTGKYKHLQRAAQYLLKLSRVAVTGNIDELRYSSADKLLIEMGLGPLVQITAQYTDAKIDEMRDAVRRERETSPDSEANLYWNPRDPLASNLAKLERSYWAKDESVRRDVKEKIIDILSESAKGVTVRATDVEAAAEAEGLTPAEVAAGIGAEVRWEKEYAKLFAKDPVAARAKLMAEAASGRLVRMTNDRGDTVFRRAYAGRTKLEANTAAMHRAIDRVFTRGGYLNEIRLSTEPGGDASVDQLPGILLDDPNNLSDSDHRRLEGAGGVSYADRRPGQRAERQDFVRRAHAVANTLSRVKNFSAPWGRVRAVTSPTGEVSLQPETPKARAALTRNGGLLNHPNMDAAVAAMNLVGPTTEEQSRLLITPVAFYRAPRASRLAQQVGTYVDMVYGPRDDLSWDQYWVIHNRSAAGAYGNTQADDALRDQDGKTVAEVEKKSEARLRESLGEGGLGRDGGDFLVRLGAVNVAGTVFAPAPGSKSSAWHVVEDAIERGHSGILSDVQSEAMTILSEEALSLAPQPGPEDSDRSVEARTHREMVALARLWSKTAREASSESAREAVSKLWSVLAGWTDSDGTKDILFKLAGPKLRDHIERIVDGGRARRAAAAFLYDTHRQLVGTGAPLDAMQWSMLPSPPSAAGAFDFRPWLKNLENYRPGLMLGKTAGIDPLSIREGLNEAGRDRVKAEKEKQARVDMQPLVASVPPVVVPPAPPPTIHMTEADIAAAMATVGIADAAELQTKKLAGRNETDEEALKRIYCMNQGAKGTK